MVTIANREIKNNGTPFIVAEAGIGHNGDVNLALRMIAAAKQAGADAVKFQTFKAEEFVADASQLFTYQSQGKEVTEPMLAMFKRYELSGDAWRRIKKKCDDENILFLSTPQNVSDLNLLLELGIPAIKVGSDDFVNLPLLKDYAKTGLPLILSCGMATMNEVNDALDAVGALNGYPTVLLVCTSQYPTPPKDANVGRVRTLIRKFPGLPIGFSDHTQGAVAATVAAGLGACFFEKHFTLDRNLPGPDHWFSENPAGLAQWAHSIRKAHVMRGSGEIGPTETEKKMRLIAHRSIVTLRPVKKGETLSAENIGLRRPGGGLPPALFDEVLGKQALTDIPTGKSIGWEEIEACHSRHEGPSGQ